MSANAKLVTDLAKAGQFAKSVIAEEARLNIDTAEVRVVDARRAAVAARVRLVAAEYALAVSRRELAEEILHDPIRIPTDPGCVQADPCGGWFDDCRSYACQSVAGAVWQEARALDAFVKMVDDTVPPIWWDGIPQFRWTYTWK